jgi:O-antigen/teichoic acid export membrane protein
MPVNKDQQQKILKGGLLLVLRQLLGIGLSVITILVVPPILGPSYYGLVATATGIFFFIVWTNKLGLDAYLIRQPELPKETPQQILAFFNTVGVGFCILLWLAAPAIGLLANQHELTAIIRWLVLPIWLEMVATVSFGMLERELRFAEVGMIEMVSQVSNSLVTIPLVFFFHWGYWGPIAGIGIQFALMALISSYYHPVKWQWRWQWQTVQPAFRYGFTYAGSELILSLKSLTPLVITRIAGAEVTGIVSVAIRFVDQTALLRTVVRRMSLSVMAKLMGNPNEAISAINRGMSYQVILMGSLGAVFSCFAVLVINFATQVFPSYGDKLLLWLPSIQIFPLVALAATIGASFDLHSAALYAAGHNREVIRFNTCFISVLWLAICLLLPIFGPWGYGFAELIALISYWLIHQSLVKLCGSPNYEQVIWLLVALTPPLLAGPWLPGWSFGLLGLSYGALFLWVPGMKKIPADLLGSLKSSRTSGRGD